MENSLKYFKNKKIFITGHTGFKGAWLSFIFDYYGAEVKGYSKEPKTTPNLFSNLNFSKSFKSVIGDIKNYTLLNKEITEFKPDFVFHLAAQPIVISSYKDPIDTYHTNFNGTLNLLESLRNLTNKCNVIIITTDKVYENKNNEISFSEDDKLGGDDPYSSSKSSAELIVSAYSKSFFNNSKVNIATARAGNIIGGGDWSEYRLMPDIIKSCFENSKLVIRNPNSVRPWQHVLDPILGYIELARNLSLQPDIFAGAWNFGPEEKKPIRVSDILSIVKSNGLKLKIIIEDDLSNKESKFLQLDISKSKKVLNWKPKWNAKNSVEYTINWYRAFYKKTPANKLIINDLKLYLK